jgi:hypothetical protein
MGLSPFLVTSRGDDCIVGVAVHNGHDTHPEFDQRSALGPDERLREEDPFTASFAQAAKIQIVALWSRFEVDFNRPREKAVYLSPEDSWGIRVWSFPPDGRMLERALRAYDDFFAAVRELIDDLLARHRRVVVLDLHSYNHRRDGPHTMPAPIECNPEVNIGTGSMDRVFWAPVVERFIRDLGRFSHRGRRFDVRENVKFQGGELCSWIHRTFPGTACGLAVEFKKTFMNEWTGKGNICEIERISNALASTLSGIREELAHLKP